MLFDRTIDHPCPFRSEHHNNVYNLAKLPGPVMADEEDAEAGLIPSLYKPPALLPIAQLKDQLLYTIETYPVTIVVGETGSGR